MANSVHVVVECPLTRIFIIIRKKSISQSAGLEPALPEGIWFLVRRLNHSATTASWKTRNRKQFKNLQRKLKCKVYFCFRCGIKKEKVSCHWHSKFLHFPNIIWKTRSYLNDFPKASTQILLHHYSQKNVVCRFLNCFLFSVFKKRSWPSG